MLTVLVVAVAAMIMFVVMIQSTVVMIQMLMLKS